MYFIYCYICSLDLPSIFKNETGKQGQRGYAVHKRSNGEL